MISTYIAMIMCLIMGLIFFLIFRKLDGTLPRNERFPDRAELSPDEFYQQYYETSGLPKDQVIIILNNIAKKLEMPVGWIRPADRFNEELKPDALNEFDDGIVVLGWDLDILLRKKGLIQIPEIKNVDEYLRYMIKLGAMEAKSYQPTYYPLADAAVVVIVLIYYLLERNIVVAIFLLIILIIIYYTSKKSRGTG